MHRNPLVLPSDNQSSEVILQIKVPNSCDVVRETEYGPKLLRRRNVRLLQLQSERYNRTNICQAGQH